MASNMAVERESEGERGERKRPRSETSHVDSTRVARDLYEECLLELPSAAVSVGSSARVHCKTPRRRRSRARRQSDGDAPKLQYRSGGLSLSGAFVGGPLCEIEI